MMETPKLDGLLERFEKDDDGWMYYGEIDPEKAAAELAALKAWAESASALLYTHQFSASINGWDACPECHAMKPTGYVRLRSIYHHEDGCALAKLIYA